MEYVITEHRFAKGAINSDANLKKMWEELTSVLDDISDDDIINEFNSETRKQKSISNSINKIIKNKLTALGWNAESNIFADKKYINKEKMGTWRLDFAKVDGIAIEVAFNHGGNVSWNLIKPVLASELNHVEKAIETKIGVVIAATNEMKKAGGFDEAVGSYEKYCQYLEPLRTLLTTPIVVIGLKAPKTFKIVQKKVGEHKTGSVERINNKKED